MKCPYCGNIDTKVVDSRANDEGTFIKRRRECEECKKRFTTYERLEMFPIFVIKKDDSRESFDRAKIERGIVRACYKRPVTAEQIAAIVDSIENKVIWSGDQEIKSSDIGEMVMEGLRGLDQVAYVRFASVYREFQDVNTFIDEIKKLMK